MSIVKLALDKDLILKNLQNSKLETSSLLNIEKYFVDRKKRRNGNEKWIEITNGKKQEKTWERYTDIKYKKLKIKTY